MLVLERRPIAAGILIGLLSYKPHFGLLLPLALLCGRHWTSFFWAAGTTVAFAALSVAAFGVDTWIAFWDNAPLARAVFEDGLVRWAKIPSAFAALRLAGAGLTVAYAVQITIAVCIAATVALVWWRRPPLPLRAATLVAGTLAATPYLFDYDFALLAIPIALIAMDGYLRGWNAGERPILGCRLGDAVGQHRDRRMDQCSGRPRLCARAVRDSGSPCIGHPGPATPHACLNADEEF